MAEKLPDKLLAEVLRIGQEHIEESQVATGASPANVASFQERRQANYDRVSLFNAGAISVALTGASSLISRQVNPFSVHLYELFFSFVLLVVAIAMTFVRSQITSEDVLLLHLSYKESRLASSARKANRALKMAFSQYDLKPDPEDHLHEVPLVLTAKPRTVLIKRLENAIAVCTLLGWLGLLVVFAQALMVASTIVSHQQSVM